MDLDKEVRIIDCDENIHFVKVENIKSISENKHFTQNRSVTTIVLKNLHNGLSSIKSHESEKSLRSKL